MSLKQTVAPAVEPVSTAEFKTHSRISISADDSLISDYLLPAAREYVEDYTRRQLIDATYKLTLDRFPNSTNIWLPLPPLDSVTSVTYIDHNGNSQTLATTEYTVDTDSEPGRIHLKYNKYWPTTQIIQNAVTVTFVAGYGTLATDVPAKIRHGIYMVAAELYENREQSVVGQMVNDLKLRMQELLFPYVISNTINLQDQYVA